MRNSIGNYFANVSFDFDKISFLKVVEQITPTHLRVLYFISKNKLLLEKENDKNGEDDDKVEIKGYEDLYQLFGGFKL